MDKKQNTSSASEIDLASDKPLPLPAQKTASQSRDVTFMPAREAYELWAPHYDNDGNFLQALDSLELERLLPEFLRRVTDTGLVKSLRIVDLGCGTGRTTAKLLTLAQEHGIQDIFGLDLSHAMLAIAQDRLDKLQASREGSATGSVNVTLEQFNISDSDALEAYPSLAKDPDAVVSTLVIEHLQLDQYFKVCASIMRPGTRLLITNMHSEQGAISGAGFLDPATGTKIRSEGFAHTIEHVVHEARNWGFEVEGGIIERGIDSEDLVKKLGSRSRKWFDAGIKVWFAIEFVRGAS